MSSPFIPNAVRTRADARELAMVRQSSSDAAEFRELADGSHDEVGYEQELMASCERQGARHSETCLGYVTTAPLGYP